MFCRYIDKGEITASKVCHNLWISQPLKFIQRPHIVIIISRQLKLRRTHNIRNIPDQNINLQIHTNNPIKIRKSPKIHPRTKPYIIPLIIHRNIKTSLIIVPDGVGIVLFDDGCIGCVVAGVILGRVDEGEMLIPVVYGSSDIFYRSVDIIVVGEYGVYIVFGLQVIFIYFLLIRIHISN